MHSARVQQRRQPQRGERPGAGGRSQLGGSRTEPRRSGPRRVASPTPVRNTSATPSATTRRQHTHVRHCRERRGGRLTSSSPRASSAAFSRTAMSTSSSRKNDARQALPSTAFTEVSVRAVPVHLREGAAQQRSSQPATRRETLGGYARSGALQQLQLCDYGGRAADTARLRRR